MFRRLRRSSSSHSEGSEDDTKKARAPKKSFWRRSLRSRRSIRKQQKRNEFDGGGSDAPLMDGMVAGKHYGDLNPEESNRPKEFTVIFDYIILL